MSRSLPDPRTPGRIRVVVAASHPALRDALALLVESEPGFALVGSGADVLAAARCVKAHHPDVLLIDDGLAQPGAGAGAGTAGTIRALRALGRDVAVLVTGMESDPAYAAASRAAGAAGFVTTDAPPDELIAAIRRAAGPPPITRSAGLAG